MSRKQFSLILAIFSVCRPWLFAKYIYIYICEVSNFVKAPNFDSPKCQIYTHTSSFGTQLICSFNDKLSNYIITENNAFTILKCNNERHCQ